MELGEYFLGKPLDTRSTDPKGKSLDDLWRGRLSGVTYSKKLSDSTLPGFTFPDLAIRILHLSHVFPAELILRDVIQTVHHV